MARHGSVRLPACAGIKCIYQRALLIGMCLAAIASQPMVHAQVSCFSAKVGTQDFHLSDITQELGSGTSIEQAIFKKLSNTPNVAVDYVHYGDGGGFAFSFGGNYGNTNFLGFGSRQVELQTLTNQSIVDTTEVNSAESYGRLRLGLGFCTNPDNAVIGAVLVTGDAGWGSSVYFKQLFAAYDPVTGYIDPGLIKVEPTTWLGVHANLSVAFTFEGANGQRQMIGTYLSLPIYMQRNEEQQVGTTPGFFLQYGLVME